VIDLLKRTAQEWIDDDAPQFGAALAYYSVFSLAPMVLLLLTLIGIVFQQDPAGVWNKIVEQMSYFLDQSAVVVVQNIAQHIASSKKTALSSAIGIGLALFGATGVFGQLQNSLNVIWGVKAKPHGNIWGFIRTRFLSFALFAGIAFLLLTSLVIKALSAYLKTFLPGALTMIVPIYLTADLLIVIAVFALIFKILPNAMIRWRDVWIGAVLTAFLFLIGKWALGIYLASGSAASAYGAASSLITLLLWIYYSSQILLFGAEFTQVYARSQGADIKPDKYAINIERREIEKPR